MTSLSRRNFLKFAGAGGAGLTLAGLAGCSGASVPSVVADTVVYGKVYTSNSNQEYVSAFAVKDGKYVYVGDEDGAKQYVKDGTTKVIDYRDKGIVMAGATEGHGHYVADAAFTYLDLVVGGATQDEILSNVKAYVEKNPDKDVYYTYGWDAIALFEIKETLEMKSKLDEICKDKILLVVDDTGHNAFFNSKAAEAAGITKDTQIEGGFLSKGQDGELLGLASDMATNYLLKHGVSNLQVVQESDYAGIAQLMEDKLHSYGYTYYQDGWTNYFGTQFMDALSTCDKNGGLSVVAGGTYKIDPYNDWKAELVKAQECAEKYPTDHFKFNTIKLFADGEAVESRTGWLLAEYADGTHGTQVWDTETMNAIVKAANEMGLSLHIHSMGDAATQQVVNAYINAESSQKGSILNGICHGRNITEDSKEKMGQHHIYAAENIIWRVLTDVTREKEDITDIYSDIATYKAGYPTKSLLDNGVLVTSSTDVPASSGMPTTVAGIIEIAVNDTRADVEIIQLDAAERVSVEQAMDIMTINGAKQLQMADERGSIETGKYADFIFINKDISTCAKDTIHEGVVEKVYFEGREVYTA